MPSVEISSANVMFVYDNVLKCPDAYILDRIRKLYRSKYEPYLNFKNMDTLTIDAMMPFIVSRNKRNILEWLAIKEFNYDNNYSMLHGKWLDMYEKSPDLNMYRVAMRFAKSYCISNVYIYNPEYDKRQHFDVTKRISNGNNNVQYCVGEDIQAVIDEIGNLHMLYDWDIERVRKLIESGVNNDLVIALARYRFNYEDNGIFLKYNLSNTDQIVTFAPYIYNDNSKYLG